MLRPITLLHVMQSTIAMRLLLGIEVGRLLSVLVGGGRLNSGLLVVARVAGMMLWRRKGVHPILATMRTLP